MSHYELERLTRQLQKRKDEANNALREAQRLTHQYAATCEPGYERDRAFRQFNEIRKIGRVE